MKRIILLLFLTAALLPGCSNGNEDVAPVQETVPTVIYEEVEMRAYSGEDGHPYVYSVITNNTDKRIVDNQYGMLAYGKDGTPPGDRLESCFQLP